MNGRKKYNIPNNVEELQGKNYEVGNLTRFLRTYNFECNGEKIEEKWLTMTQLKMAASNSLCRF